jgi:PTS system cellobiose-specific IIC component
MNKLIELGQKMSGNRYLSAIRNGFITALPLTLSAAFAVLINNVILANNLPYGLANPDYYGAEFIDFIKNIKFIFSSVEFGSLQWITPVVLMGISYSLSEKSAAEKPFVNALIIFAVFVVLLPKGELVSGGYWQSASAPGYKAAVAEGLNVATFSGLFSGANLFTGLVVSIGFTELLLKLQKVKRLEITLPEQVPPMVAKSFSTLIPAFMTLTLGGIVATLFMYFKPLGFGDMSTFITGVIQEPFLALARTGLGGSIISIIYISVSHILWLFGLHGTSILAGFREPTLTVLGIQNQTLYAQTGNAFAPELATFTRGFIDTYVHAGGAGATLGLIFATSLVSKRDDYKAISKIALPSGIFQINEPIIFGMPIVLNPILAVPFVVAPLACLVLPAILTSVGILPKVVVQVPWVTPPVINAFLATGGNIFAALVGAINLVIATLIYIPFVKAANKVAATDAMEVGQETSETETGI